MRHGRRDHAETPLNVYRKITQVRAFACRHCRAKARLEAQTDELTFEESARLLRQIPELGEPPQRSHEREKLLAWGGETGRRSPFWVAKTEAPSCRRVAVQMIKQEG